MAEYSELDLKNTSVPFWGHSIAQKLLENDKAIAKFPLWMVFFLWMVVSYNFQMNSSFNFFRHY